MKIGGELERSKSTWRGEVDPTLRFGSLFTAGCLLVAMIEEDRLDNIHTQ